MARRPRRKTRTAPPVWASAAIEAWYRDKLQACLTEMNKSLTLHIRAAWREADPSIGFGSDASPSVTLRRALTKWGGLWTQKLNDLSKDVSKKFADKNYRYTDTAMKAAFAKAGFAVAFKPTIASVEAYRTVAAQQVNLIKSIPAQYLKDVQTEVWQTVMRGGDMASLSVGLQQKYGLAFKRAALIARDQTHKAKAIMENVRRQELGFTEAIWMHSHAGKEPRPTHVKMDGKPFKLSEGMWDEDEGKNVWPGELINCRCASRVILPGFDTPA